MSLMGPGSFLSILPNGRIGRKRSGTDIACPDYDLAVKLQNLSYNRHDLIHTVSAMGKWRHVGPTCATSNSTYDDIRLDKKNIGVNVTSINVIC